ncbi:hypothetical protein BD626DRAFT_535684 [Schizophyllum amplum]|uniref:Uncharacterized protein n=1 Tax=Schizophyllum amplum TaxID=97359 RepID=A0A550CK05_9AGAR|nr:hypothetical protein BD626DRAFT_535684 [Auriculariopsis ampla]
MSPMSPPHPYTAKSVAVANYSPPADDEDNDICPVCDGECTCNNARSPPPPRVFLAPTKDINDGRVAHASPAPDTSTSPHSTKLPSLKIKLTVPPSLLGKRRAQPSHKSKHLHESASAFPIAESNVGASTSSQPSILDLASMPKRRGRPTKAVVAARLAAAAQAGLTPSQTVSRLRKPKPKSMHTPSIPRPNGFKARGTTDKKGKKKQVFIPKKRRRVVSSSSDSSSDDERHDVPSDVFPTFVSASAMSSSSSSSSSESDDDSSPLSEFDSDDSMAAEEENFIVSEEARTREKARVKRELLGDENPQRRRDHRNGWIIRTRMKSEGPSDEEMAVDSDATEDDEEQGMEADEEEDEEDDEDEDGSRVGEGYVGLATGWSDEEEESSFDADLFFASLEASDDDKDGSSDSRGAGDQSDLDMSVDDDDAAIVDNMPFELTEGWNGELLFTNGIIPADMFHLDFDHTDASAAPTSPSPSQSDDAGMSTTEVEEGYEQDVDAEEGEGDGDTTDEELVGEDDLPNERAMQIFSFPPSVSAINPLSTMSPVISRIRPRLESVGMDSPRPADILAGRTLFHNEDSDEFDEPDVRSPSHTRSASSSVDGPRAGAFDIVVGVKHVVIDDSKTNIPSPHPRAVRGRGRGISMSSLSGLGPSEGMEAFLRQLPNLRPSSVPAPDRTQPAVFSGSENEVASPEPFRPLQGPIELDDVLDASSFMDAEPSSADSALDGDARRHIKSLRRWDLISVGAFRQTHESGMVSDAAAGWTSDTPGDLSSMIRSSPMRHHLLWEDPRPRERHHPRVRDLVDRDGDRTPTQALDLNNGHGPSHDTAIHNTGTYHSSHNHTSASAPIPIDDSTDLSPGKTRKQLRQERKLKGKAMAAQQTQFSRGHRHHLGHPAHQHQRQHHPNMKARSMGGVQRSKGFGSSSPVPSSSL